MGTFLGCIAISQCSHVCQMWIQFLALLLWQVNVATRDAALAPGAIDSMSFFEGTYSLAPLNTKTTMNPVEVVISSHNGAPCCTPLLNWISNLTVFRASRGTSQSETPRLLTSKIRI